MATFENNGTLFTLVDRMGEKMIKSESISNPLENSFFPLSHFDASAEDSDEEIMTAVQEWSENHE